MRAAAFLLVSTLVACASDEPADDVLGNEDDGFGDLDGKADAPLPADWLALGTGVAYRQVNTGAGVLIAYGGYSAQLSYSIGWAEELVDARLGGVDVGHIYAVKGPVDPSYSAREIANTKLRAHLKSLSLGGAPIFIVAHSSGSYVAHEVLTQSHDAGDAELLARMRYANLDGGGSGLTQAIVEELGAITFVYARDPAKGRSQNASTAIALGQAFAEHGTSFEVNVAQTGCNSGAGWCLHDVVITHRPHNPNSYDLARDYTDFVNRPVTTEYFDALIPQL